MNYYKDLAIRLEHEGWLAAAENVPENKCPYPVGAPEREFWEEGYRNYIDEFNDWLDEVGVWAYAEYA